jgi:hypothetical protein
MQCMPAPQTSRRAGPMSADRGERSRRRWLLSLGALALVRAAIPLAALAASGDKLPGFPPYSYDGPKGDAGGYISVARAIISAGASFGLLLPLLLVLAVTGVLAARWAWRRYPDQRHWVVAATVGLVSCLAAAVILRIEGQAGAGAVGWPLVLSIPLLPFRVLGWIDDEVAFGVGLAVSILANAVTVFATGFIGFLATGSRRVGLGAAALFTFWPFLIFLLLGKQTWENSAWEIDAGLSLYTEPLSTACVAAGLALVLVKGRPPWAVVAAGIVFGYAAAVRPTNIVFAVAAALLFAWERDWRSVWRFAVGGVTVLPVMLAFLPKKRGYNLELARDDTGAPLWSGDYVVSAFSDSSVWRPLLLAVLLPLVAVGVAALRLRGVAFVLLGGALANAAIYAFFRATPEHPRYLQAGLPALLVLWSAGAAWLAARTERRSEVVHVRSS